jgi:hypothetical protein
MVKALVSFACSFSIERRMVRYAEEMSLGGALF